MKGGLQGKGDYRKLRRHTRNRGLQELLRRHTGNRGTTGERGTAGRIWSITWKYVEGTEGNSNNKLMIMVIIKRNKKSLKSL